MSYCVGCENIVGNDLYCIERANKRFLFCSETCMNKMKNNSLCVCGKIIVDSMNNVFCSEKCCLIWKKNNLCVHCLDRKQDKNIEFKTYDRYGRHNNPVYFCSNECKELFVKTRCNLCGNDERFQEYNGHLYCASELIDCYDLASGEYTCSFCVKNKHVDNSYCVLIESFHDGEDLLCCEECADNVEHHEYIRYGTNWNGTKWSGIDTKIYEKKWRKTRTCKYNEIKNKLHRLICNECGEMVIYHKLSVVDGKNVCESCRQ